jgi:hypothetical protein
MQTRIIQTQVAEEEFVLIKLTALKQKKTLKQFIKETLLEKCKGESDD